MSESELAFLLSPDVQQFIAQNIYQLPADLMLTSTPYSKTQMVAIVGQIQARRKAQTKLPTWYNTPQIIFPITLSLEQSSSEVAARFKSDYLAQRKLKLSTITDLTGGFGVDTYFFSQRFREVNYVEQNEELAQQVAHNLKQLETENVKIHVAKAETYIEANTQKLDIIYLDPARRDQEKNKVFRLEDCTPKIFEILPALWQRTSDVVLKLSPMLDIGLGIQQLGKVVEVVVVAINNECKELLFWLSNDQKEPTTEIRILTINISAASMQIFDFTRNQEAQAKARFSEPLQYIYEPNVAILKAGAFKQIGHRFNLAKLHPHSHLYTSEDLVKNFPGRTFRLKAVCKYNKKEILKHLPSKKVNITTRNFPDSVANVRKKIGLKEGGEEYLLLTQTLERKTVALITEKI